MPRWPTTTVEERFWSRVDRWDPDHCWLWTGPLNNGGYGSTSIATSRVAMAHRYSYELLIGPIPDGLEIDHLCRVRHCVNPGHLEAVTRSQNLRRGVGLPAERAKRTHCPRGHPLSGDNLSVSLKGQRSCLACRPIRWKEYKEKRRAAAVSR